MGESKKFLLQIIMIFESTDLGLFKTSKIFEIGWKTKKLQPIEVGGESGRKIPKRHVCHTKLGERAL